MNADVVIIGAGPAGIFTALEMIKKGSRQKIIMVEKGQAVENRHCPKDKTKKCVNCKPYCHITTGFSGAGAFSDGKLSLSYEVGGDLPTLITPELAQETINYADQIYLDFGADEHIEGLGNDEERKEIRKHAIQAGLKLVDCPIRHLGTGAAVDAVPHLGLGAVPLFHRLALFHQQHLLFAAAAQQLHSGKDAGRARTHDDQIVLFHFLFFLAVFTKICRIIITFML